MFFFFHWRTLLAFGFYIGFNEDHTEDRVKHIRLAAKYVCVKLFHIGNILQHPGVFLHYHLFIPLFRYEQPGGYRPAPVDLSRVFLSSEHEELVNLLAENEHNVWARDRIKQGWTYGAQQVYILSCITVCCGNTEEEYNAYKQVILCAAVYSATHKLFFVLFSIFYSLYL